MIYYSDTSRIEDIFALIFSYGLKHKYSLPTLEKLLLKSRFIESLENGDYEFDIDDSKYIFDVFKEDGKQEEIYVSASYYAQIYVTLFFEFHKSFGYIFLYLPLSTLEKLYPIYHEMDITQIMNYFKNQINETTLLRKLVKVSNYKLTQLSSMLGIDINTLKKYTMNDSYIFNASYKNIYKLSKALDVKENIFIESLNVYIDSFISNDLYRYDNVMSYLGLFFASYIDHDIKENSYVYDPFNKMFYSKKNDTFIASLYPGSPSLNLNDKIEKTYLVLFAPIEIIEKFQKDLTGAKKIYIVNDKDITNYKNNKKVNIDSKIVETIITRAKKIVNYSEYN